jgi:hypothetical protein
MSDDSGKSDERTEINRLLVQSYKNLTPTIGHQSSELGHDTDFISV